MRRDKTILRWWNELITLPIGGITTDNCRPLVEAGANFLCIAGGVWNYPDGPSARVRAVNAAK